MSNFVENELILCADKEKLLAWFSNIATIGINDKEMFIKIR